MVGGDTVSGVVDTVFWGSQRVLVTGHTGFKGAWLCLWLRQMGAEVTGLSLAPSTDPALFVLSGLGGDMDSRIGSINDRAMVDAAVVDADPTVIFHLAAQALVRESYADPVETFATNVVGTANVLDAARAAPSLQAVVSVTSDKCYENQEWDWSYRENEPMGGHDPYSASKGCAELVTAAMRRSFFADDRKVGIGTARAGNVIGGGDWSKDRLIPDIIRAFSAGEEVVIRRPEAVRPWQHVLEPLSGYLLLAQRLTETLDGEGWNFGPADSDSREVRWIVQRMADRWGADRLDAVDAFDAVDALNPPSPTSSINARPAPPWRIERDGPHEATLLKLDSSKARNRLGWAPRLDLETTIEWLVDWYRAHLEGEDMRALTQKQIADFHAMPALVGH